MKQTHPFEFLKLLRWLDNRKLMDCLMPYQLKEIEEAFWTFTPEGMPQYIRVLFGRGKKNAKTLCGVLLALWLCLVWKAAGNKGNQVYYIASDMGQANDDLDLTKKLVYKNQVIHREVEVRRNVIERKDGDGFIEILPAQDVQGLHGKTYLALICDEWHTQKDYRVLEALELDRTRPDARQIFLSYASPYRHAGVPLVDMIKQHEAKTDSRLYVAWHAGSIEEANPSLNGPLGHTMEDILQAQRSLPSWVFRRLYLNLPGMPDGAAFDPDTVENCIVKGRMVLPPKEGIEYTAFTDMSGGGPDDSTLAIAHKEQDGKVVLDLLMDQGPRRGTFDPNLAVAKFAATLKEYRVSRVTGDRFAGEWPRKAFESHGIAYVVCDQTKSELYAGLEPLVNSGSVELLDSPKLFEQVLGLIFKGTKIDHPQNEHDDFINGAAGVSVLATARPGVPVAEGFDDTRHVCSQRLPPIKGEPILVGQTFGLTPATVIGQLRAGYLRVYAALVHERGGIRQHYEREAVPWISQNVPWVFEEASMVIGRYDPVGDILGVDEAPALTVQKLLPGYWSPAPNKWEAQRELLLDWLTRTVSFEPALQIDPVDAKPLIQALSGQWYREDGRDRPKENPPWSSVGMAFVHLLAATMPVRDRHERLTVESRFDVMNPRYEDEIITVDE